MAEDTELDAFLEDSAADATEAEDIVNELEQDPESMEPQTFTVRGHVCEIRFSRKRIDLYEERHTPIIASFYKNDGMFTFKGACGHRGLRPEGTGRRLLPAAEGRGNREQAHRHERLPRRVPGRDDGASARLRFFIQGRRELALTRLTSFDYFTAKPKSGEAAQRRRPVLQGGRLRVLRRQARLGLRAVRAAHARAARVRAQRA